MNCARILMVTLPAPPIAGSFTRAHHRYAAQSRFAVPRPATGFTIIELLVVVTIIITLIALLLPALSKVKVTARRTHCLSNIRNQSVAFITYANDNDGWLPTAHFRTDGYPSDLCTIDGGLAKTLTEYGLEDGGTGSISNDRASIRTIWSCPAAASRGSYPRMYSLNNGLFLIDQYYLLTGLKKSLYFIGEDSPSRLEDPVSAMIADTYVAQPANLSTWYGYHGRGRAI